MNTRILTIVAVAFGATILGSSGAMAQRAVPTIDIPTPEPCFIRCVPPGDTTPDPEGDPDPMGGPAGPESVVFVIGCDVRDGGLVFRNLGDMTVAARTKLQWATSDGKSGRVTLGQAMDPKTAWLYAGATAAPKSDCSVTVI